MKRLSLLLLYALTLVLISCSGNKTNRQPKQYSPDWESLKTHQTPDWFVDGKFGIYFQKKGCLKLEHG